MKKIKCIYLVVAVITLLSSCAVIRPGEVALKVKFGKIKPDILKPGIHSTGLIGTKVERF